MAINEIKGNLFNSEAKALVNTVNCEGVMGRGIALEFRRRFPIMFQKYQKECELGYYHPGDIYFYEERGKIIVNCAVKNHWRYPSKMEWVESCLKNFSIECMKKNIESVAFPWMGTKNGKLPFIQVQQLMRKCLNMLSDVDVEIYDFDPAAGDPLFTRLENIAMSSNPESHQIISGIRKDSYRTIMDAVRKGRVTSLHMLATKSVVGEKTLDRIYQLLIDLESSDNTPTQMSFF